MLETINKKFLAVLLLLTSCTSSLVSYDDTVYSLNRYVDLVNAGYDAVYYLSDDLYYYEVDVENYDALAALGQGPSFTCSFYIADKDLLYEDVMNPSANLTEEEQTSLTTKAQALYDVLNTLESSCLELETYVYYEDYIVDLFAGSDQILESIYSSSDTYQTAHNDLLDTVDDLFDKYETFEVDTSDPVSLSLSYMRESIDLAEEGLDLIENMYTIEDFSQVQELSILYGELEAMLTNHVINKPALTDEYASLYYDYYYIDLEETYLPTLKQAMLDCSNEDLESLDYSYSYLVDYYNLLTDDYNYFLDNSGY